jgi:hypothetical protein
MRLVACVLACVGAGGMALALADPPATPAPAASAASPSTQSAASVAAPAASAPAPTAQAPTSTVNVEAEREQQEEKHFLAEGYKLEMHNGEKMFCRREEQMGTRLGAQKFCSTAQQLEVTEREAKAAVQRGNTQQLNPSGK